MICSDRLQCRLRLLPEDTALCKLIGDAYNVSPSEVIAHAWSLMCRALRTGRDPLTGEPIDWKAAAYSDHVPPEMRDFLRESQAMIAGQRKRKRRPLFDR